MPTTMTIRGLAEATGLAPKTIRFYEEKRLLPVPARSAAGYRLYGEADLRRLTLLRRAGALGCSRKEARGVLQLAEHETCSSFEGELSREIDRKLREVDQLLAQLGETRKELASLAEGLTESTCADCQEAALTCCS